MNCPNCGAPEAEGTQPADASCSFFKCGSIVGIGIVTTSWPCRELAQLRSKLKPEGAEPLKWHYEHGMRTWWGTSFSSLVPIYSIRQCQFKTLTFCKLRYTPGLDDVVEEYDDVDAAKAHAEELHQAAWRELIEKWGRK